MLKQMENADGRSCWNRALPNEMTFVLLGRDAAAPVAIRAWVAERILLGKNTKDDHQILEALQCAEFMEANRMPEWAKTYWDGSKCTFDPERNLCECQPRR